MRVREPRARASLWVAEVARGSHPDVDGARPPSRCAQGRVLVDAGRRTSPSAPLSAGRADQESPHRGRRGRSTPSGRVGRHARTGDRHATMAARRGVVSRRSIVHARCAHGALGGTGPPLRADETFGICCRGFLRAPSAIRLPHAAMASGPECACASLLDGHAPLGRGHARDGRGEGPLDRRVRRPSQGARARLSAADLAAALVVSTALSWVIESQGLVCRRRPHHGSQLRNDARPQDGAHRMPTGRRSGLMTTRDLVCPKCSGRMGSYERSGIVVDQCQDCRGIFLDQGELERMVDTEGGGWSGRVGEPSGQPDADSRGARDDSHDRDRDRDRRRSRRGARHVARAAWATCSICSEGSDRMA